jgi:Fe-S-cluster containining protein
MATNSPLRVLYDCDRCPAYCCTYARIQVTKRDIARLARRFEITPEQAWKRFTCSGEKPGERILRHKKDELFGTACRFLDLETRKCTVYEHRPGVCREYPGTPRCGYYEFLKFERSAQGDEDVVITAWVADE